MYFKTSDNLNLYYELHGNLQSDKSIIFLNGLAQNTVARQLMLPAFVKDYKIILCDFIFQGKSDKQCDARDFDQHAKDVYELINSLNISKINVVGISYGSLVAQHIALNHPEKVNKLILLSSFAHKTPYFEAIELTWNNAIDLGGYNSLIDIMLPAVPDENYFKHPLISIDKIKAARKEQNIDTLALKKLMKATYQRGDYREKLKSVAHSTLIIHGEQDTLVSLGMAKELANSIKDSRFEIVLKAGHVLNVEAAHKVNELIIQFIEN